MNDFLTNHISLIYSCVFFVVGLIPAAFHHQRSKGEIKGELCYEAHTNGFLPQIMFACGIALTFVLGFQQGIHWFISSCFVIALQSSLYYLILIPLMPLLQKRFRATTCAVLWLLPNWIYILIYPHIEIWLEAPSFILPIPAVIVWIWLAGFFLFLLYQIVSHLRFRKQILQNAYDVTEYHILELCEEIRKEVGTAKGDVGIVPNHAFRLVRSPAIQTPLSIGFFKKTIRLVLPEKDYTMDELRLILRHECVHISRNDSISKWVMTFCTALSWFNPLVWIAMKKCAENLELSCDETVLLNTDEATRRQYADLILTTAGDSRGFTTCLSATTTSLRYRLKNIISSPRPRIGSWLLPIGLVILSLGFGHVALAYGETTGEKAIFHGNAEEYILESATRNVWILDPAAYIGPDEEALEVFKNRLTELTLCRLTGRYYFNQHDMEAYSFIYQTSDETVYVAITEHTLTINHHYDSPLRHLFKEVYHILPSPDNENPLVNLHNYFEPIN